MKNVFFSFVCLCLGCITGFSKCPVDGDNLYVFTKQLNVPAIYSLDELDKITFSEKGINFWNTKWPTEYAYENFCLITFSDSDDLNSIDQVLTDNGIVRIIYDREKDKIYVRSDKTLRGITVFDVQGRPIASNNSSTNTYELSLLSMSRGIYIVKVKGSSISQKIVK